jgi:hypothetical protein
MGGKIMTRPQDPKSSKLTLAVFLSVFIFSAVATARAQNTYQAYDIATVAQPAKTQSYKDPIFGTQVMRITDETDGKVATVAYSYWSIFNSNSKMFIIGIDGVPFLYKLNPKKLKFKKLGPVFDNDQMQWEGMSWSATDPNVVYGVSGYNSAVKLRGYNVKTRKYVFEHDFTALGELPAGIAHQMSKARSNDRYFSFDFRVKDEGSVKYAVVYDKELNKTYLYDVDDPNYGKGDFDECRLDRDGNFLVIVGEKDFYVWQFPTQPPENRSLVVNNIDQRAGGHYESGSGLLVNADIWGNNGNRLIRRTLSNPVTWVNMFDSGVQDWQTDHHLSMTGPNDEWTLVTTMTYSETPNYIFPFTNEIFLTKTDGSGKVQRLVQHHSSNKDYWGTPRANVSPDGQFIAYTSDWGGSHIDVYIAVVPKEIWKNSSDKKSLKSGSATQEIKAAPTKDQKEEVEQNQIKVLPMNEGAKRSIDPIKLQRVACSVINLF